LDSVVITLPSGLSKLSDSKSRIYDSRQPASMSDSAKYRIEQLNPKKHRRDDFTCESPALTEFLHKRARKEMDARASACFVLVEDRDPGRVVGYYTLSQLSVTVQKLPESVSRKLPRYPELGATLIGRLARDVEWCGKGIGELLLIDALRRSVRVSAEAGAVVVMTDPKDEKARKFYEEFGFLPLDETRLFIPMKEVIQRDQEGWST
jgi:predicted N-acetyltransferase YhbS